MFARLAIGGTPESGSTGVNCAATLLAPYVPGTRDSGAVLTLSDRSTSTTRLQFDGGVNALIISSSESSNGAGIGTSGAEAQVAGLARTLSPAVARRLGSGGFAAAFVVVPAPGVVTRGWGRRGVTRDTAFLLVVPIPSTARAIIAFGRGGRRRRSSVRQTAASLLVPELVIATASSDKGRKSGEDGEAGSETGKERDRKSVV